MKIQVDYRKWVVVWAWVASILILDQATKLYVHHHFQWGESIVVIDRFFNLTYVRNMGAAFGFMHDFNPAIREPFFLLVPIVATFILIGFLSKVAVLKSLQGVAFILILGGAVGNFIDRLRFGFVIDFLDFHWDEIYHWPAFNVADSCIVIGMIFLLTSNLYSTRS